jgi:hypothetical protein
MVHLRFHSGAANDSLIVGPAPWFRVAGNFVRQGPHGAIVGTFRRHIWEVGSVYYPVYEVAEPHSIHFEDAAGGVGPVLGPYARLKVEDGLMHEDGGLTAKFMEQAQLWLCYETETYWPVLVIESAAEQV